MSLSFQVGLGRFYLEELGPGAYPNKYFVVYEGGYLTLVNLASLALVVKP